MCICGGPFPEQYVVVYDVLCSASFLNHKWLHWFKQTLTWENSQIRISFEHFFTDFSNGISWHWKTSVDSLSVRQHFALALFNHKWLYWFKQTFNWENASFELLDSFHQCDQCSQKLSLCVTSNWMSVAYECNLGVKTNQTCIYYS